MPVRELPKAHKLREYEGTVIEIVSIRTVTGKEGKPARIATLNAKESDGRNVEVWIPNHTDFAGEAAGRYTVVGFDSEEWGTRGWALRNAPADGSDVTPAENPPV